MAAPARVRLAPTVLQKATSAAFKDNKRDGKDFLMTKGDGMALSDYAMSILICP